MDGHGTTLKKNCDEAQQERRINVPTPKTAIRLYCLDCCKGQPSEVKLCQVVRCSLHPYRMNNKPDWSHYSETMKMNRAKAIRQHCLDCSDGQKEVATCTGEFADDWKCQLVAYRMGKGNKKNLGEAQRKAMGERLKLWRQSKEQL